MEHLCSVNAMGEVLLSYYIETALKCGQSINTVMEQLRGKLNLDSFTYVSIGEMDCMIQ